MVVMCLVGGEAALVVGKVKFSKEILGALKYCLWLLLDKAVRDGTSQLKALPV